MHTECLGEVMQAQQGQVYPAVLDLAEIRLGEPGDLAERLLLHRPLFSEPGYVAADQRPDIHTGQCRPMSGRSLFAQTNMVRKQQGVGHA